MTDEYIKVSRKPACCHVGDTFNHAQIVCAHYTECFNNSQGASYPCNGEPVMFIRPDQYNVYIKIRLTE